MRTIILKVYVLYTIKKWNLLDRLKAEADKYKGVFK
jgi:hypothetical protein